MGMQIVEKFQEKMGPRGFQAACVGSILVVLGGCFAVGIAVSNKTRAIAMTRTALADMKYPLEPLLARIAALGTPPPEMQAEVDRRLKFELASLNIKIEKAKRPEEFRAVDRVLDMFEAVSPDALKKQLAGARMYRAAHEEKVEFAALDYQVAHTRPYAEAARAFLKKYPSSKNLGRVNEWLHRSEQAAEATDRAELEALKVKTREDFEKKLDLIKKFLEKHPGLADATEMRRAVEVGTRLLTGTSVKIKVVAAGRFNSGREFSVRVLVNGKLIQEAFSDGDAQDAQWEKDFPLEWTVGQPIAVVLYDYRWANEEAARRETGGAIALRALDGHRELEPAGTWEPYFEGKPWAEFHTEDVTAEEWNLLDTYFTAD